jgi:predicted phosphoribosyltransferase
VPGLRAPAREKKKIFLDRADAGRQLAATLKAYKRQAVVVYALPRGGAVLGIEVARFLRAPLDLIVVRKIGHPLQPEYAIGAVAEDGYVIANPREVATSDRRWFDHAIAAALKEAQRRRALFLNGQSPVPVKDKTAIIVDDGLATGLTMLAAVHEIRKRRPQRIVVAVPVAAAETVDKLRPEVDELISLYVPHGFFGAIGNFYEDFKQVTDEEVIAILKSSAEVAVTST